MGIEIVHGTHDLRVLELRYTIFSFNNKPSTPLDGIIFSRVMMG